jgi:hypothetical protein
MTYKIVDLKKYSKTEIKVEAFIKALFERMTFQLCSPPKNPEHKSSNQKVK